MEGGTLIETDRLLVRSWREANIESFHAMHADPEVIRFLYDEPPSLDAVRALVEVRRALQAEVGYCFWAVELRDTGELIGFCGLEPGYAGTPIAGWTEIGWRLARPYWRRGYAHEAARASLAWGAANGLGRVAAITVPANERSRRLMDRLGLTRDGEGVFNHPALSPGHRLSRHLTYRIARPVQ